MRRLPAAASTATTKKKNSRPTGAKKVIFDGERAGVELLRQHQADGLAGDEAGEGPVAAPAVRGRACVDGESVPAGKSTLAKSVSSARWKRAHLARAGGELVAPALGAARAIGDVQARCSPGAKMARHSATPPAMRASTLSPCSSRTSKPS